MRDARAWPIAHRWTFLAISVRAWKLPRLALDRMHLSPVEIPQDLLRQLFETDADYAEALWALDQPDGSVDRRNTLPALDQLPTACAQFRKRLPSRARPTSQQLEGSILKKLSPKEAYNVVPGRDPEIV